MDPGGYLGYEAREALYISCHTLYFSGTLELKKPTSSKNISTVTNTLKHTRIILYTLSSQQRNNNGVVSMNNALPFRACVPLFLFCLSFGILVRLFNNLFKEAHKHMICIFAYIYILLYIPFTVSDISCGYGGRAVDPAKGDFLAEGDISPIQSFLFFLQEASAPSTLYGTECILRWFLPFYFVWTIKKGHIHTHNQIYRLVQWKPTDWTRKDFVE